LYEFFANFFNFEKFVKIRDFFAEVTNSRSMAKTAKLTTPTLQPFPAQQKFSLKSRLLALPLGCMHLQLTPINYPKHFSRPGGAPLATPVSILLDNNADNKDFTCNRGPNRIINSVLVANDLTCK